MWNDVAYSSVKAAHFVLMTVLPAQTLMYKCFIALPWVINEAQPSLFDLGQPSAKQQIHCSSFTANFIAVRGDKIQLIGNSVLHLYTFTRKQRIKMLSAHTMKYWVSGSPSLHPILSFQFFSATDIVQGSWIPPIEYFERWTRFQKVKPKHLDFPLVAGCSIGHKTPWC